MFKASCPCIFLRCADTNFWREILKTLVEDEELMRLRAMAEGTKPFEPSGLWHKLSALDWSELKKLPARERLGVGYYTAARRRAESLKEGCSRDGCAN